MRYLAMKKKQKGEELTEEEQELLKFKRTSKDEGEEDDPKAKKPAKGKPKKGKDKKVEEEVVEVKQDRPMPLSKDHNMVEIKTFLKSLEAPRMRK